MITQDYLKSILHYCPDTGIFTWKHRSDVKPEWNTRWAGKVAGVPYNLGYVGIGILGKKHLAHRLAYLYMTGCLPSQVDHKNGIRNDNRWSNIRACNNFINSRNQKKRSTNTSGHNGVYWSKTKLKWYVRIGLNGKNLHGGYFIDKEDAIKARKELDKKLGYFEHHGKEKGA
jgi:hypothetical protein